LYVFIIIKLDYWLMNLRTLYNAVHSGKKDASPDQISLCIIMFELENYHFDLYVGRSNYFFRNTVESCCYAAS